MDMHARLWIDFNQNAMFTLFSRAHPNISAYVALPDDISPKLLQNSALGVKHDQF